MKKIILYISIAILTVSCDDIQENAYKAQVLEYDAASSRKSFASDNKIKEASIVRKDNVTVERKLIKTGNITFETKELEATRKTILDLVHQNNGYVASDNQYKSHDRISTTIAVRVPAKNFDTILEGIAKGVEKFDNKSINISDVTEQFLDVQARLKTKKALEVKYLEILKKAKTVREILDVERELGKLRADIESTEGRLKYLQNQVSFSTLNITFYKKTAADESTFGSKFGNAFKDGFENIKAFFIFIIKIWPFIIILLLVFFYLRRRISRTKS